MDSTNKGMDKMKNYGFLAKALSYINLESDVDDFDKIHETIEKDLIFKGTNLWILAFAIIVASVGLNVNSTAVIIGAMLISPLMGPINGMGYSIATYNSVLFRKALKNFSFAVAASLIASTVYFFLSPLSTAHSELLARTSPTIYDVIIALFGGLAGIVAISSKHKGNVIPGVAIATALMPPLCTAGYGLATLQFGYFFGAIYLFTINTVFIAISSVIISQILKFPIRTVVGINHKKRINQLISLVITLVFVPSIYFGYILVKKEKFQTNANQFVSEVRIADNSFLLKNKIDPEKKTIHLIYGGVTLNDEQKNNIKLKALDYSLDTSKIDFQQGLSFDFLTKRSDEEENTTMEMNQIRQVLFEKIEQLEKMSLPNKGKEQLLNELKVLFPAIVSINYAEAGPDSETDSIQENLQIIILKSAKNKLNVQDQLKIEKWIQIRLNSRNTKLIFEETKAGKTDNAK
jgi:uncharacterized hydrophobic protein (TIGR00271 family)